MPRRAYVADLRKLEESVAEPGILSVRQGNDDGEFKITIAPNNNAARYDISALIPDVSEYPSNYELYLYITDDDAPEFVSKTLEQLPNTAGRDLFDLMRMLSQAFASPDKDGDCLMTDSQDDCEAFDDFEDEFDTDDADFGLETHARSAVQKSAAFTKAPSIRTTAEFRQRIKSDLRLVHGAGFKVGVHGALLEGGNCYVAVSCRVAKLGISEEAMSAWELSGKEYLVLLISFPNGYMTVDQLRALNSHSVRSSVEFRVGVMKDGKAYKPTIQETVRAFAQLAADGYNQTSQTHEEITSVPATGFRDVFISKPLNVLLNERFVNILKHRYMGMPWQGAERFYNDIQGKNLVIESSDFLDSDYTEEEVCNKTFPDLVMADHIKDSFPGDPLSLPLLAMQFLLRHFVRCTDFCLVCHCRLDDDLEAIKPYVCNKDLCLYQYMTLGFGPSIEHEIVSQPYVVDLLISFCYTRAVAGKLSEFPSGLNLHVPPGHVFPTEPVNVWNYCYVPQGKAQVQSTTSAPDGSCIRARFDRVKRELLFDSNVHPCPVNLDKWIVIKYPDDLNGELLHCRIVETTLFPSVKVSEPLVNVRDADADADADLKKNKKDPAPSYGFQDVSLWNYDVDFDSLPDVDKNIAIVNLLHLLPKVKEMKQHLLSHKNASLERWNDRMPNACFQVLRWIIASNRACIMQVDNPEDSNKSEERLYGMKGWMQFRFAMGAPDKERRFLDSVKEVSDRLGQKYPTIFAWHGSPLFNWHSIIREGLHFKDVAHGRAFGNGVYFSLEYNVSSGYSGYIYNNVGPWKMPSSSSSRALTSVKNKPTGWPASELKVSTAISLNEIVNAPNEFVSRHPYLVIPQLDWIQTRYLFVQIGGDLKLDDKDDRKPAEVFQQDPSMTPKGASDTIRIPINAISRSRGGKSQSVTTNQGGVKAKAKFGKFSGTFVDPILLDDESDNASVQTETEDLNILLDEDIQLISSTPVATKSPTSQATTFGAVEKKGKAKLMDGVRSFLNSTKPSSKPLTDFVPGQLDFSKLTILAEPKFATPSASKRLQKDYQTLLKVQNSNPLHELGWYTDPEQFNNVYQWIIELHSFDEKLPLAKQMKEKGIKSVVIEMRFGPDYPMTPPFIRVIRPRFLGFNQGGGGHVTAGGSICMELLTNSGWSAVSTIESVLLQVRLAMSSTDPKPAQLEYGPPRMYGIGEAIDAYMRACRTHGWRVPPGFVEMAYAGEKVRGYGAF